VFTLDSETLTVTVTGNGTVKSVDTAINCTSTGGTTCTSTYNFGTTVTLNATNNVGSHFTTWSDPACGTTNPCTLTMSAAKSIKATFVINAHTVTVTISGTGGGNAVSQEGTPKINCSYSHPTQTGTCAANYNYGDSVTITATADVATSFFNGGTVTGSPSPACTGSPCTFAVGDNDIGVALTFDRNPVPISISISGNGSGNVSDAATTFICLSSCIDKVAYGVSSVTLTASPATGSAVTWGGCTSMTGNTCTLTGPITTPMSVSAAFTLNSETLTVAANGGNGTGSVTCAVNGGSSGACPAAVNYSDKIVFTESPVLGSNFTSWSLTCDSATATSCTINSIVANTTMTATFTKQTETLTVNTNGGNGSGTVTCAVNGVSSTTCPASVNYGDKVVFTEAPTLGSNFKSWSLTCDSSTATTCTINSIVANATMTATFTKQTETLTVNTNGGTGSGTATCAVNGGSSGSCPASVNYGDNVVVTATANASSTFTSWTGCTSVNNNVCTLTNVTANAAVTATFAIKTFTLSASIQKTVSGSGTQTTLTFSNPPGATCTMPNAVTGTFSCTPNSYPYGTTVTITASTGSLAIFSGWSGACISPARATCTVTMTQDQSLVAYANSNTNSCVGGGVQAYDPSVEGCSGAVSYASRNSLCGANCRACSAQEYVMHSTGALLPSFNYWTDDALRFSNNGAGAGNVCGPVGCFANNCFVSTATVGTTSCPSTQPMHVCTPSGSDSLGNTCSWSGCGFNTDSPSQSFGGCNGARDNTAGTLCCCGLMQWGVDAVIGNDANIGSVAQPFKTITKSLSVAGPGEEILVKPGIYSAANGEIFPLQIPPNVALIGDEANRGVGTQPTQIAGSQTTSSVHNAVLMNANSTLAGFEVTFSFSVAANYAAIDQVSTAATGTVVRNNTLRGSGLQNDYGLQITSTGNTALLNTGRNNFSAFSMIGTGTGGAKFENNIMAENNYGFIDYGGAVDLGDGGVGSVGNNLISCNFWDLYVGSSATLNAQGDLWHHFPPTIINGSQSSAFDISNVGNAAINTDGGSAYSDGGTPCPF
jgi:hypothetical protein